MAKAMRPKQVDRVAEGHLRVAFGEMLLNLRVSQGMETSTEAARALGMTYARYCEFERGARRPAAEHWDSIADYYGLSPAQRKKIGKAVLKVEFPVLYEFFTGENAAEGVEEDLRAISRIGHTKVSR